MLQFSLLPFGKPGLRLSRWRWWLAAVMVLFGVAPALLAQTPSAPAVAAKGVPIDAAVLARANRLERITLSPDGKMIAVATVSGSQEGLAILDAADRQVVRTLAFPPRHQLEWYDWAGSGKLVLKLSSALRSRNGNGRATVLMAYDLVSRRIWELGPVRLAGFSDTVIHRDPAGQYVLVSSRPKGWGFPEVRRISLTKPDDVRSQRIEPASEPIQQWIADANGVVRYGVGWSGTKRLKIWYRDRAGESLRPLPDWPADLFTADSEVRLAVMPSTPEALMLERGKDGRVSLTRRPLAGNGPSEVVYAPAGRDVIDFSTDRHGHLVSAVEADDQLHVHWFDPNLQKVQDKLVRALNSPQVGIVSRAEDNSRMLIWAGSTRDPGAYWLYDLRTGNVATFNEVVPGLNLNLTSEPRAITYSARDGTPVRAYLTMPRGDDGRPRALIVMPHGGPFGVRDYLGFDAWAQFLASRGYAVIQPNFRGSSGYGLAFARLGEGQMGRAMQDDLDDAMDWAVKSGIADAGRVCLVGASYGGYAALWGAIRNPERYRCAASLAGVTNLAKILRYDRRFLKGDFYENFEDKVQGGDDVDLDLFSPEKQVARLTRPVLLAHGSSDVTVPFDQYEDMVSAAKRAGKPIETLVLTDEGHNLAKPENRLRWMETLARFLAQHNPAD